MKVLVTGADGFLGRHLSARLRQSGFDVLALGREQCDVLDRVRLRKIIAENRPAKIFHLAAQSLPVRSWDRPVETFRVNVEGTLNLLESVRQISDKTVVLVAGSSSEYAVNPDGRPISENEA